MPPRSTSQSPPAPLDWCGLSDEMQVSIAREAMRRATLIIADQAELFALQFSGAMLADRGASDALMLFATLLRETGTACLQPAGHA